MLGTATRCSHALIDLQYRFLQSRFLDSGAIAELPADRFENLQNTLCVPTFKKAMLLFKYIGSQRPRCVPGTARRCSLANIDLSGKS